MKIQHFSFSYYTKYGKDKIYTFFANLTTLFSGKEINIRLRLNLLDGKTFGNYLRKHGDVFNICSKLEISDIHNG